MCICDVMIAYVVALVSDWNIGPDNELGFGRTRIEGVQVVLCHCHVCGDHDLTAGYLIHVPC